MKPNLPPALLALYTCSFLLAACGGGGGGGNMVRSGPPPAAPPPPPPVASAENVCPAPLTGDCVVDDGWDTNTLYLRDGRQSTHRLIKRGQNSLTLVRGTYAFGGTSVEGGLLHVLTNASLDSTVDVQAGGTLLVSGAVHGDVVNRGQLVLSGSVTGQVTNHGLLSPGATVYDSSVTSLLVGDLRQTASGTFRVALPPANWDFHGLLRVTGRADIEGGTLEFYQYYDWDTGYYPLPTASSTIPVLHADGGVFGQFDRWTAPGLFVEGSIRYGSHDVWFDLTRASVQAVMAAGAAGPMTLGSAANLDAALAGADGFALSPNASAAQRRFLASAASLLHARDVARATRSLDSLSGHGHGLAQDMVHRQAAATVAQLDARLDRLPGGTRAGLWSAPLAHHGRLGGSVDGQASGFDQWLSPHWLIGGSVSRAQSQLQFERMGGHGQGDSPLASVHAHYRGNDWHATGVVGAGRTTVQLQRPIDLGAAGVHVAHARRELDQAFAHGEVGRRVLLGNGRLTPFVAVDYSALHSDGFSEQGDTGFELVAQPGLTSQWSAAAGARYAHDWKFGDRGWLRLDLDARYQQRLADGGARQQAAFAGVPDALFELKAWSRAEAGATVKLGLAGGFDPHWRWSLDYARHFGNATRPGDWFAGLRRGF